MKLRIVQVRTMIVDTDEWRHEYDSTAEQEPDSEIIAAVTSDNGQLIELMSEQFGWNVLSVHLLHD